jgi:hypothetical protein
MLARDEKQQERALELEEYRAQLKIEEQIDEERRIREVTNSPFAYSLDEARKRVSEHTGGGAVPAFLIAPFQHDYPGERVPAFTFAVRRAWRAAPWSGDMNVFDGLITRPLAFPDVDLQTMRSALYDLPVIVVHGNVQANARLWISLTGWNLWEGDGTPVLDIDLAPLMLPPADPGNVQERLEFEDAAAYAVSLVAGAYAEWFHILTSARLPRMHAQLPAGLDPVARSFAANSAALYDSCISRGMVSEVRARLAQAVILSEVGLVDEAVAVAGSVLGKRQLDDGEIPVLAVLLQRLLGSSAGTRLAREIDQLQRHILLVQTGMGELL